jgi:hypothetical protein
MTHSHLFEKDRKEPSRNSHPGCPCSLESCSSSNFGTSRSQIQQTEDSLANTTQNTSITLTALGRTDVPVYPGAARPFCRDELVTVNIHGTLRCPFCMKYLVSLCNYYKFNWIGRYSKGASCVSAHNERFKCDSGYARSSTRSATKNGLAGCHRTTYECCTDFLLRFLN